MEGSCPGQGVGLHYNTRPVIVSWGADGCGKTDNSTRATAEARIAIGSASMPASWAAAGGLSARNGSYASFCVVGWAETLWILS